jgi:mevalonate kinase
MTVGYAPGKVILCGEHAVVYGRPAIAVPVTEVQAQAHIAPARDSHGVLIDAPDLNRRVIVRDAPDDDPLARIVRLALKALRVDQEPDLTITVTSAVPIARGMGSGAAVSTAIVRGLAAHLGGWLSSRAISDLVYQTELIYHGTPSGIDNTVVAFEKPVYFIKDVRCEIFWVGQPFLLAVADTGVASPTREVVSGLRRRYRADPDGYAPLFDQAGAIADAARVAIERGEIEPLGGLLNENHSLLQQMGVSSPDLDRLVTAARQGGALGAKMSGAGRGGNMIALVSEETRNAVDLALRLAGAVRVIVTEIK